MRTETFIRLLSKFSNSFERTVKVRLNGKEHNFQNGVEQSVKVLVPTSDQSKVSNLINRLLKDFTNEELKEIAKSPEFIIATLTITKQSIIKFVFSNYICQKN